MSIDAQANLRTIRDVLRYAVTRMNEAGVFFGHGQADSVDEALFLVLRSLQLPLERADLFLDAFLTHAEINTLLQAVDQRARKRVPAAYILREAWLQGYKFYVDERVIVPRSFLAELLKDGLAPWVHKPEAVADLLDMCTGSGCLAIIAADVFPQAQVDAADISPDALAVARRNIADYQMDRRVSPVQSDLYGELPSKRYDIILCNPPYVTDESMAALPREYQHEPKLSLAGGADGMSIVRRLVRGARGYLKRGGLLFVEVGGGRAAVEQALKDVPLTWLTTSDGDDTVFLAKQEELP
ncbi:MAG: 50S ribosomal protein L3 N(5)-glutamine methyltransferase [Burkholderiales bacterium]|jgi:ribosomal protein L3 glutamine methyltransferase|nr:50S ribosomal protein L3 N(5)-glutamine methyltransferase [Burkholderiales bacterium]